jgi:hypothetical protein
MTWLSVPAADDAQTARDERVGEHRGVLLDLLLVGLEGRSQRLAEGDRLGRR